jgi:hypothetical protein
LARLEGKSLGEAVSTLARKGLRSTAAAIEVREGFPVFILPRDAPPMTSDLIRAALDDE